MICQLGPRGASSDAGAQRTTRDKYGASAGCSAAKGPGRLRDDRLFSSDDITILVHGKWGFATTGAIACPVPRVRRVDEGHGGAVVLVAGRVAFVLWATPRDARTNLNDSDAAV